MFFVNEDSIKLNHEKFILNSVELQTHLKFINGVLDSVDRYVRADPHLDDSDLVYLRLLTRCFNSLAAAVTLSVRGYWQPSFTLARDFVETGDLLDLFSFDRSALSDWIQSHRKSRWKKYGPKIVRERLNTRDGHKLQKRDETYSLLSTYAAHPSPDGFQIMAVGELTQVGPFPNDMKLLSVFQELAKHCDQLSRTIWARTESLSGAKKVVCDDWRLHSANWFNALRTF